MSKRFDINYFLGDESVKHALKQYEDGYRAGAKENMWIILRAYGLTDIVDAESVIKACIDHPLRNPV